MRNLKKFLALVLAFMMAMSLMVTANAVTENVEFSDTNTVIDEFRDDVIVLSGMGVIKGHADTGTFAPKAPVTRAQMAAIVYRLATGDASDARSHVYGSYGGFSDVDPTAWYAGYVGYCADAGYIQGYPNGTFKPNDPVTGYAALAMVLRAMGYTHPGNNFTGNGWRAEVGSIATQKGMLININKTVYASTLNNNAPRELVAEIGFQAANPAHPMVEWTNAFGYQETSYTGSMTTGEQRVVNPSLGRLYYGLAVERNGVIVGNQDTGESVTRLSVAKNVITTGLVYAYGQVALDDADNPTAFAAVDGTHAAINTILNLRNNKVGNDTMKTGETTLNQFGHKVEAWYNVNTNATYAIFDSAAAAGVIKTDANPASGIDALNTPARQQIGMRVGTTAHVPLEFFGRFYNYAHTSISANKSPVNLYSLIDNTGNGVADVVIPLNIETSRITAVDNVSAVKTVTVPTAQTPTSPVFNDDEVAYSAGPPVVTASATIEQGALLPGSTKTLRDYEMGIHVTGTNGTWNPGVSAWDNRNSDGYEPEGDLNSTAFFKLHPIDAPITATVVAYNTSNGKLTLSDGKTLEKSKFYDTVVGGTVLTGVVATIPQRTAYEYGTYRIWLDYEGKYLGAVLTYDNSFVYGTYTDYNTVTSSGAFEYLLTGVTLEGEKTTVPVVTKTWINPNATSNPDTGAIGATDALDTPYRDSTNQVNNGIGEGVYKGWVVNDKNASDQSYGTVGVTQGNRVNFSNIPNPVITPVNVALGAIQVNDGTTGTNLFWTNDTKIILVSGYGTSDLKVEKYNGIGDLMKDCRSVEILWDTVAGNLPGTSMNHIKSDTLVEQMTYYTSSPFVYAQTGATGYKMDTVIMPAAAVQRNGSNSLYYIGDPTPNLFNAYGEIATRFTMYQDGVQKNVWIEGTVNGFGGYTSATGSAGTILANMNKLLGNGGTTDKGVYDQFYRLIPTGATANDGQPIYALDTYTGATNPVTGDATASNGIISVSEYTATTYSSQAASFTQTVSASHGNTALTVPAGAAGTFNVANAKVVNVNLEELGAAFSDWPGVTNLTTLNEAGSLNIYGGAEKVYVTAILNADNPLMVDYIYVCYLQDF